VTAVFSWSVRHLRPADLRVFRLVGLHPGPDFDQYAAAALADIGLREASHALDVLVRAHLVHTTTPGRYGMHDLLRAYAASLAAADGPEDALRRMFDYYLATTAQAMDGLYPAEAHRRPRVPPVATPAPALADADTAREWLDAERSALTSVAWYAAATGRPSHTVRLSTTLFRYLDGGYPLDALALHGQACQAAEQAGDRVGKAHALISLGTAYMQMGRYQPAADHFEPALTLFRRTGDRTGEARALCNLGVVAGRLGRFGTATQYLRQGRALFRVTGDRVGEARVLVILGDIQERTGRYDRAVEHLEQALRMFRQAGDRIGEAWALADLGLVEDRLRRYRPAADHLDQALILFRLLGSRSGEAWSQDSLGAVHNHLGRTEQAMDHYSQALDLFREIGDRDGEAWSLNGLGECARAAGNPVQALTHHLAAADTGARDQQARAHAGLAHAYEALSEPVPARQHYERALALFTELGMPDAAHLRDRLDALSTTGTSG
jgi:tetratricopeptide (TPR) repeat protein